MGERWADLSDEALYERLVARSVTAAQAAWVVNNRNSDIEALVVIQHVLSQQTFDDRPAPRVERTGTGGVL